MSISDFSVCRQEFRLLSLHGMATACFRLGEVVSRILMLTMFSCAYNVPLMGAVMAVDFFILVLLTNSQRRLNYPGSGAVPRILVTSGDIFKCVLAVLVSTACSRCFGIVSSAASAIIIQCIIIADVRDTVLGAWDNCAGVSVARFGFLQLNPIPCV